MDGESKNINFNKNYLNSSLSPEAKEILTDLSFLIQEGLVEDEFLNEILDACPQIIPFIKKSN